MAVIFVCDSCGIKFGTARYTRSFPAAFLDESDGKRFLLTVRIESSHDLCETCIRNVISEGEMARGAGRRDASDAELIYRMNDETLIDDFFKSRFPPFPPPEETR